MLVSVNAMNSKESGRPDFDERCGSCLHGVKMVAATGVAPHIWGIETQRRL